MKDENGRPTITAEAFEQRYADRSGMTVDRLRSLGRFVKPCDCDYEECEGWQSTNDERWATEIDLRPWLAGSEPWG